MAQVANEVKHEFYRAYRHARLLRDGWLSKSQHPIHKAVDRLFDELPGRLFFFALSAVLGGHDPLTFPIQIRLLFYKTGCHWFVKRVHA